MLLRNMLLTMWLRNMLLTMLLRNMFLTMLLRYMVHTYASHAIVLNQNWSGAIRVIANRIINSAEAIWPLVKPRNCDRILFIVCRGEKMDLWQQLLKLARTARVTLASDRM